MVRVNRNAGEVMQGPQAHAGETARGEAVRGHGYQGETLQGRLPCWPQGKDSVVSRLLHGVSFEPR